MLHCQALQKVSKLEAENQSIEQVRISPLYLNHLLGVSWHVLSCLFFFSTVEGADDASGSPAGKADRQSSNLRGDGAGTQAAKIFSRLTRIVLYLY